MDLPGFRLAEWLRRGLLLSLLVLFAASAPAADFVYLIDTSTSIKNTYRAPLLELVRFDIAHALSGANPVYQAGDQIHVWNFDLDVQEKLKLDYQTAAEAELQTRISAKLDQLKMGGRTSLTKPLAAALQQFGPGTSNELSVVLYTDGRGSFTKKEADYIVRLFKFYYEPSARLADLVLVRFGDRPLAKENADLIASIGGRMIQAGDPLRLRTKPSVLTTNRQPKTKVSSVISVTPLAIEFSNAPAPQIIHIIPLEFKVEPPQPGLLVSLGLEATNLPAGMTLTLAADRIAADGTQAVPLKAQGAQPGHHTARLVLTAPVPIQPVSIPVSLRIYESAPDRIGLQFFSDSAAVIDFPEDRQWHRIRNAGLSFLYPDRLKDAPVRFEGELPQGVELQALAGADPAKPIELGRVVKLGELGHLVGFQLRSTSTNVIGKPLAAKIALRLQTGQNVQTDGTDQVTIPFRFLVAGEVRVETSEIALGQVLRGTRGIKRTLNLQVKGEAAGKKLRVVKRGQGLAGINITPSEFLLMPGAMSLDLEFSGFDDRPSGVIDGTFALSAEESAAVSLQGGLVTVRGTLPSPGNVVAEIENPMVAGQPFYIRARLDSQTNTTFRVLVRGPESNKEFEVTLSDSGLAEDGDAKPNDGTYSGAFKRTESLGKYQVTISCAGTKAGVQTINLNVPYYFKAQADPLAGSLAQRRDGRYLQRQFKIVSEYPGPIALHMEPGDSQTALSTFVSTKNLASGENAIDLVVGLPPGTRSGEHKYKVHLITDPIGESRARIPVTLEITVVSFFQYFVKLLSFALAIGGVVLLGVLTPWKRRKGRSATGRPDYQSPREEADETLA